jgi:hypothetical protein
MSQGEGRGQTAGGGEGRDDSVLAVLNNPKGMVCSPSSLSPRLRGERWQVGLAR